MEVKPYYYLVLLEVVMKKAVRSLLCITLKGLSTSLEGFNFLRINWKELIQKCSGRGELEIKSDHCGSLDSIP